MKHAIELPRHSLIVGNIDAVEAKYKAKFLGDFQIRERYGWYPEPCALFWTEEKHPEGSNYFVITFSQGYPVITNGITATEGQIWAWLHEDGTVLYSRYLHDFRGYKGFSVDGGRDYHRGVGDPVGFKRVVLTIEGAQVYMEDVA